MNYRSWPILQR